MRYGYVRPLLVLLVAAMATPAVGSIDGTYSGNFITGVQGGAAYSYIHESTSASKKGNANYYQNAGGKVIFAMDIEDDISFSVTDNGAAGFGEGDVIDLNFEVGLLRFDGFGASNTGSTGTIVGKLTVEGSLTVGGTHDHERSSSFTNGIRNITAADQDESFSGLNYTIDVVNGFSINGNNYVAGDQFTGDAFFQSGALAGPFNGINYDEVTKTISFAIWGNSRNMDDDGDPHETGHFNGIDQSLGFDIFIEAQVVPEASSLIVWSLLTCLGLSLVRQKTRA